MTPLEKAARAVCELEGGDWDAKSFAHTPSGNDPEDMRRGYIDIARAVLMAVREPGESAETAGDNAPYRHLVWERMIDAILNEE